MLALVRRFALMLIVVTMLVAKIAFFIVAVVVIADVEAKAVVAVAVVIGFIRSFMATVPVSPHQCGAVSFPRTPAAQGGRRRRLALIDAWRPASPIGRHRDGLGAEIYGDGLGAAVRTADGYSDDSVGHRHCVCRMGRCGDGHFIARFDGVARANG